MRKTIFKIGLFLLAFLLPTGCGSDDEFPDLKEEDILGIVSDFGKVCYSGDVEEFTGEHRWFIMSSTGHIRGNLYFPINLPKEYKIEGISVKYKGNIYPYKFKGSYAVAGYNYYFIDLMELEKYENEQ